MLHEALQKGLIRAVALDLDGVIYCHSTGVEERSFEGLCRAFIEMSGMSEQDTLTLLKQSYHTHGASCIGHEARGIAAAEMAHRAYHDLPLDGIEPCAQLRAQLLQLQQCFSRVVIGTNSTLIHPQRVLQARGVGDIFTDQDIVSLCKAGFVPKPQAGFFEVVLAATGTKASETLFIEDSPRNLEALKSMGFYTAQVTSVGEFAREVSPHADMHAPTLQDVLAVVLEKAVVSSAA